MIQSDLRVLEVARWQRYVLLCLLANIASIFLRQPLIFLILLPIQLYCVYTLARSVGASKVTVWFWLAGMFLPLISLVLLLVLSQRATKAIRETGFKVGLMGANLKEIQTRMNEYSPSPNR